MKQRLLIVDDEPGIVDMMASYFSSQYEVLTAYCGNEALQKLARQPDLILLDINMPDIDGLTLCQKIRELITCPILFLTARVESADKIIGFQAGADDYIIKPFDLDELGARVAAHLRREQRHRNMEMLQSIWKKMGKTLVIITHDSRIARMADRQFVIVDGVLSEVTAR